MPDQDGLRFLFDIQDKISQKLAKIEAKSKASAAKIDKAFTRASKSQEANSARAIAAEQRRISAVNKAHARALEAIKRESEAFKRSMTRMASAATVAFAAVAGKALDMASGYDAAMRSVQAKTGATGAVLDKLSAQAREMGRTTVHSATQAARGQAFLAQAGFDAHEILQALPGTLALATAGELDLASAADIASNVLSGFRLETEHTGRVTDVLAAIAARTNTSVSQMGVALAKAAPSAAAAGWSLEETAAAIGRLSDAGIQAEEAGTVLKTMLARLAAPTGKLEKLMTATGISVQDTSGKMLPLNDIIAQLAPHADNTGLMFELLGTRGANAGLILGSLGDKNLRDLTKELENSEGAAQKMADIMGGGLWGSIKKIQSIVESAYISFGKRLGPAVEKAANLFAKLPGPIQEVTVVVGSLVGAMGGLMLIMPQSFGALVQFPGKLLKLGKALKATTIAQRALNMAMRLNPIGLVITAVAALAAGIYLLWKRYNKLEETFDVTAASTEDLTARYDDLTEKVAAATAKVERAQKTYRRGVPIAAKALRALEAERDELGRHIQQREDAAKTTKKLAEAEKKATKERKKATEVLKKATEAAKKSAEAVQGLIDVWTGATLKSGEFLRAFEKLTPEQKKNDRIMDQVLRKYESMRKVLGPFNDELEELRRATQRWTPALAALNQEQDKLAHLAVDAGEGLAALDIEVQNVGMSQDTWDIALQASNNSLGDQIAAYAESQKAASGYELALASLAGQMGGTSGQALNMVIAMREHNKEQKAAAAAGKKTEAEFSKIQVGAAGLGAAFGAIGEAIGGAAGAVLAELGSIAQAFATGGIVAGIMAGIGSLIKGLKGLFGRGKRKREKAAREERERLAEVAAAAEEAAERMRAAAEKAAAEIKAYWDSVYSAAIPAFERARDAGVAAYDEIFQAALESGLGQEEAVARATAAQEAASAKILKAEGEKFARMAAFEAALEAIRSGNAEGAADAAALAAAETRAAWETAMDAVTVADQAATDSMIDTARKVAEIKKRAAREAADAQIAADRRAAAAAAAAASQPDPYAGVPEHFRHFIPGFQHGGHVQANRPIMVGEAGPEMFVPSQSGRIEPHGSSSGGVDAKDLARAVAAALEGTRVDVDGRQLGRLTIRHQPLAVTELGGQR